MRQGKAKYVFPGSNTPAGFVSFYRKGLVNIQRLFILKGGPGTGKSTLMRKIGLAMLERGYDVEFWQCSSDNDSLDGVLITDLSVAVIDGTAPHAIDPLYPGAVDEIVNLGDHWDDEYLRNHKTEIIKIGQEISANFELCYSKLAQAGQIRHQQSQLMQEHRDEEQIAQTQQNLLEEIFAKQTPPVRRLFASAITPRGLVNLTDSLSRSYPRRYILLGPPGSGKEKVMAAISARAEECGHKLEIYHNTFDPQQIELITLPDLRVAIADFGDQERENTSTDRIIDFKNFLAPTEDQKATKELHKSHQELIDEAASALAQAKANHDTLEAYYCKAMDFEAVDETGNRIFHKILSWAAADKQPE